MGVPLLWTVGVPFQTVTVDRGSTVLYRYCAPWEYRSTVTGTIEKNKNTLRAITQLSISVTRSPVRVEGFLQEFGRAEPLRGPAAGVWGEPVTNTAEAYEFNRFLEYSRSGDNEQKLPTCNTKLLNLPKLS